jgi:hypothetical protein
VAGAKQKSELQVWSSHALTRISRLPVLRQNAIRRRKWAWFNGSVVVLAVAFDYGSVVR